MKTLHLLLITLLAGAASVRATVLTFDITGATDGVAMPQAYGDRVTSTTDGSFSYAAAGGFTPNVVVDYTSPDAPIDLNFWSTGYNELVNVVENEPDGEAGYTIRLTADSGFFVRLDGFDLGNFGGAVTLTGLRVVDGDGNVLFSLSNIAVGANSGPHQDYDFAGGLFGAQLNIIVDTTGMGGNSDNMGLDNIQFGQDVVPEPSSYAMLVLGGATFLVLAARNRARRLIARCD
jgi:PEP-CTERM motif-containing protein